MPRAPHLTNPRQNAGCRKPGRWLTAHNEFSHSTPAARLQGRHGRQSRSQASPSPRAPRQGYLSACFVRESLEVARWHHHHGDPQCVLHHVDAVAFSSSASFASMLEQEAGRGHHEVATNRIATPKARMRAPMAARHVEHREFGPDEHARRPVGPAAPRGRSPESHAQASWAGSQRLRQRSCSARRQRMSPTYPLPCLRLRICAGRHHLEGCAVHGSNCCGVRWNFGSGTGSSRSFRLAHHLQHLLARDVPPQAGAVAPFAESCSRTARRRHLPTGPQGRCRCLRDTMIQG
mmetsp:Transcript_49620/g.99940  ORF Transcript_49620/g.99940 Transcript_49620/m.99940 type:complete len:291 (+) Transcript_49620:91-963(+)